MDKCIIQVPMNADMVTALDALGRNMGSPRAELIRRACKDYLERLETARLVREYVEGYERIPETPDIGEAQAKMLADVLESEKW